MNITHTKVIIKQKVETLEIFTGFETKNRYAICDEEEHDLFYAFEESSFWARNLLGSKRSLKINIVDKNKRPLLIIERPFAFFFPVHTVKSPDGKILGTIKQKFVWLKSVFEVKGPSGNPLFTCISKLPHPWTFNIFEDDRNIAQILKKWGGLGREIFTDADTFLINFDGINDPRLKELVLAAAFAVDLKVFERKS